MPAPTLVLQTTYAELLERCATTAFSDAFPDNGVFTSKTIKGRRYWYFQMPSEEGREQRYVGPETPELLERISHHKQARDDERERRALVSTLVRSFGQPRPVPEIGKIIAALAKAGIFRLRGVLVGTAAYQTYSAMLGTRLPLATLQTGDVDIAQFKNVSVATGDRTRPIIDVLKEVNKSFYPVPHVGDGRRVTSYAAKGGLRVDFLTPNEGPETDTPQFLPAFQTDAQPLRFLDFLIHDPITAVILHGAGVHVNVPAPERFAVHKLIVSRRRHNGTKRDKDINQAGALLELLSQKQPLELKVVWQEASNRGRRWRDLIAEGMSQLEPRSRDITLKAIGERRAIVPGLKLTFNNPPAVYDFGRDIVTFKGEALGVQVQCAISRGALDDHFGAEGLGADGRKDRFLKNRSKIEAMARIKYVLWPIEEPGEILIKTEDVPDLQKELTRVANSKRSAKPIVC
jgi:hypothetical protein